MLDINLIRSEPDRVKRGIASKNSDPALVDQFLAIDKDWRGLVKELEDVRSMQKKLGEERRIDEAKDIKEKMKNMEYDLRSIEKKRDDILFAIPNLPSADTPVGKYESENNVLKKFKEPPTLDFKPKDHMELGTTLNLIDTEKASKISGARFNYLLNEAVLLQFAIIQFVLKTLTDKRIIKELADKVGNPFDRPFTPVIPPVIAKAEIMKKMDRFDPINDRYYLEQDNALLVGSAEHTMGPLHIDEILSEKDLPLRYIGYGTAFRREAGSYGQDTAGILRRHQFDKIEMETFVAAEHGLKEQDFIVAIQEYLVQQLDIPYQLIIKCTGDMGKPDFRAIDVECWMPGQGKYRETHTSDYMADYQSRRLNTKVRKSDGSLEFIHMNDGTAFAIGRILIAILENYQEKDGSVAIPEVLRKYAGFDSITRKDQ
ncbi:serine--tRNA ligase [Candidatus Wolfebacteria bacterium]|nr:serine--tRNA ligase [Candidatus Wolfebacteria bacterium]